MQRQRAVVKRSLQEELAESTSGSSSDSSRSPMVPSSKCAKKPPSTISKLPLSKVLVFVRYDGALALSSTCSLLRNKCARDEDIRTTFQQLSQQWLFVDSQWEAMMSKQDCEHVWLEKIAERKEDEGDNSDWSAMSSTMIKTATKFSKFYANWSSADPAVDSDDEDTDAEVDPDDLVDEERECQGLPRYPLRSKNQESTSLLKSQPGRRKSKRDPPCSAAFGPLHSAVSGPSNSNTEEEPPPQVDTEVAVYRWANHAWTLYLRFSEAQDVPVALQSAFQDLMAHPPLMAFVCVHAAVKLDGAVLGSLPFTTVLETILPGFNLPKLSSYGISKGSPKGEWHKDATNCVISLTTAFYQVLFNHPPEGFSCCSIADDVSFNMMELFASKTTRDPEKLRTIAALYYSTISNPRTSGLQPIFRVLACLAIHNPRTSGAIPPLPLSVQHLVGFTEEEISSVFEAICAIEKLPKKRKSAARSIIDLISPAPIVMRLRQQCINS